MQLVAKDQGTTAVTASCEIIQVKIEEHGILPWKGLQRPTTQRSLFTFEEMEPIRI